MFPTSLGTCRSLSSGDPVKKPANLIIHRIRTKDWRLVKDRNGEFYRAQVLVPAEFKGFDTRKAVFNPAPATLVSSKEVAFHATRAQNLVIRIHW